MAFTKSTGRQCPLDEWIKNDCFVWCGFGLKNYLEYIQRHICEYHCRRSAGNINRYLACMSSLHWTIGWFHISVLISANICCDILRDNPSHFQMSFWRLLTVVQISLKWITLFTRKMKMCWKIDERHSNQYLESWNLTQERESCA